MMIKLEKNVNGAGASHRAGRSILSAGLLTVCMTAAVVCAPMHPLAAEKTVTPGVYVENMDVGGLTKAQLKELVYAKVAEMGQKQATLKINDQTMTASLNDLGLTWGNPEIVSEIMDLGTHGNIIQRYKDKKDVQESRKDFTLEFSVNEESAAAIAASCTAYNTEPVEATIYITDELTPGVSGGTDGITVNVAGCQAAIVNALNGWDGESDVTVDVPLMLRKPEVTYEELAQIKDVLGQATTDYSSSSWERATNVENGCSKISGTLLYPGDYFSVTDAVVPFSAENGYQPAPSYEENRVVDSYGGGICQVSTTLYNAVLKSELEVVARSNHTMVVSYVDLSKDAAIAEGNMDFAFVNNLDAPIYIVGYTYGGQISFIIYGHDTRPANRSLEFVSQTVQTIQPTAGKIYANAGMPVGYINQTQSPHTGYVAELWKNIYIDGVWQDSVQVNTSYYDAVGVIYDVGVASQNPALTQAMYAAIGTGSLGNVQATIAQASAYGNPQAAGNGAIMPDVDE